jgi:hypothetical protein
MSAARFKSRSQAQDEGRATTRSLLRAPLRRFAVLTALARRLPVRLTWASRCIGPHFRNLNRNRGSVAWPEPSRPLPFLMVPRERG